MKRWNQDVVVSNHRKAQATAMGIDVTGSTAVLGSKRHLIMIDLDNPAVVKSKINVGIKYEMNKVLWNPSKDHGQYFLTTYNHNADVWQCNPDASGTRLATVQGHTRAISDASWSYSHPNMMGTCSADSFICIWDIRDVKRAKFTMSTVAGAGQIKWNKRNDHSIASSHDGNIRVWDLRQPKQPVQYIMAHVSNIYSIDWSPLCEHTLVSASQDSTICFWDTSNGPNYAKFRINAGFPVWHVQYNPMHDSITSVSFKSLRKTPICLWDVNGMDTLAQTFSEHVDVVLNCHWRKQKDKNNWQLVTWSRDHSLRFCQPTYDFSQYAVVNEAETSHDAAVGAGGGGGGSVVSVLLGNVANEVFYDDSAENTEISEYTARQHQQQLHSGESTPIKSRPQTLSDHLNDRRSKSYSLDSELNSVKLLDLRGIQIEETSASSRFCVASVAWNSIKFKLTIKFPKGYPLYDLPRFEFVSLQPDSAEVRKLREYLLQVVERTSATCCTSEILGYLSVCLRDISESLQRRQRNVNASHSATGADGVASGGGSGGSSVFDDENAKRHKKIPFPRTCGASFCGAGYLVVFTGPTILKSSPSAVSGIERTPKTLKGYHTFHPQQQQPQQQQQQQQQQLQQQFQHDCGSGSVDNVSCTGSIGGGSIGGSIGGGGSIAGSPTTSVLLRGNSTTTNRHRRQQSKSTSRDPPQVGTSAAADSKQMMRKVFIFDLTSQQPFSKALSHKYKLQVSADMCKENKQHAADAKRFDLSRLWAFVELLPDPVAVRKPLANELCQHFAQTPIGGNFLDTLYDYYAKRKDVQTLSMLSLYHYRGGKQPEATETTTEQAAAAAAAANLLSGNKLKKCSSENFNKFSEAPTTPKPAAPIATNSKQQQLSKSQQKQQQQLSKSQQRKSKELRPQHHVYHPRHLSNPECLIRGNVRGNSYEPTKSLKNYSSIKTTGGGERTATPTTKKTVKLPQQAGENRLKYNHDEAILTYRDYLKRVGLPYRSAEVEAYLSNKALSNQDTIDVRAPSRPVWGGSLQTKRKLDGNSKCAICHVLMRRCSFTFCVKCGHGGHMGHIKVWFQTNEECPIATCVCACLV